MPGGLRRSATTYCQFPVPFIPNRVTQVIMQKIKYKLARNELVRMIGVGRLMHHNFLQILGIQGGFDGVWFDHEHVGFGMEQLEIATLATRSVGLENFVRVAPTD